MGTQRKRGHLIYDSEDSSQCSLTNDALIGSNFREEIRQQYDLQEEQLLF